MKIYHLAIATLIAAVAALPAQAADEAARFRLTPSLISKVQTADPQLRKFDIKDSDEDVSDDWTLDDSVRELEKAIEQEPEARAIVARQGMSTHQFALTTVAMMHASLYLGFEPYLDKQKRAQELATYTPEQRANIELVRKLDAAFKASTK